MQYFPGNMSQSSGVFHEYQLRWNFFVTKISNPNDYSALFKLHKEGFTQPVLTKPVLLKLHSFT